MSLARQAGVLWDDFEGPARALAVKAGGEFHTLSGAPLAEIKKAADQYSSEVKKRHFPSEKHTYQMNLSLVEKNEIK